MKNPKILTVSIGLIIIALTLLFYFLVFDSIATSTILWVSLIFVLLSEILAIIKFLFIKEGIISQACIFTSILHFIITIILFAIFGVFFQNTVKLYIFLNVLSICVISIVDLSILYFAKKFTQEDKRLSLNQGTLIICQEKAQSLVVLFEQSEYKKDLQEISDLIKFSDNTELTQDENAIINKLCDLESQLRENGDNVTQLISEIKDIINLRSIKIKNLKRGGY